MPIAVVSPFNVADFPEGGGHFWVYLQYVRALHHLGWDVHWLERVRATGDGDAAAARLSAFRSRLLRLGLTTRPLLYVDNGNGDAGAAPRTYLGMEREEAEAVFARADLLLNFHYAIAPGLLHRFRRTALVDIDPGLLQFWMSRGQLDVPPHDVYFTTAEPHLGSGSAVTNCGLEWLPTRPPICLDLWPFAGDAAAPAFTTVSSWDGDDWIVDADRTYENTKRVAFLEFADLPRYTDQPLELALYLRTEQDLADRRELERLGWRVRLSQVVAGSPESYRTYIQQSRGEFSCAKRSYVRFANGWVSDRTLCYLASGKPAAVQDTGARTSLPNGEGVFRFSTLPQAVAALAAINADYERHSRAARQIAETFFDGKRVVASLVERAAA